MSFIWLKDNRSFLDKLTKKESKFRYGWRDGGYVGAYIIVRELNNTILEQKFKFDYLYTQCNPPEPGRTLCSTVNYIVLRDKTPEENAILLNLYKDRIIKTLESLGFTASLKTLSDDNKVISLDKFDEFSDGAIKFAVMIKNYDSYIDTSKEGWEEEEKALREEMNNSRDSTVYDTIPKVVKV